jgi:hypothetical protein
MIQSNQTKNTCCIQGLQDMWRQHISHHKSLSFIQLHESSTAICVKMAVWHTGYAIQAALSRCNGTLNPKPTLNCNVSKITIIVLSRAILQQHTEVHTGSFSCNYTKHSVTSTSHSRIPFKFCTCTQLCNRKHPKKKKRHAGHNLDQQYNICRLEFGGAHIADLRRTKILQINQE